MHSSRPSRTEMRPTVSGFSLTELAVVLLIVALLIGGLLIPLTSQVHIENQSKTEKSLSEIREALLGFAAATGRLPCPSSATSAGVESFCTNDFPAICGPEIVVPPNPMPAHGRCSVPYNGFVPAVTLGISPVDGRGFALDAWQTPIRYGISEDPTSSDMSTNAGGPWRKSFTTASGIRNTGLSGLHPDLHVCSYGPETVTLQCPTAPPPPPLRIPLSTSAVAVIYSLGRNAASGGGTGIDEAANLDGNRVFVFHQPAPTGGANGEFDDIVIWLSPNILYNRMIAAGQLP